MDKEHFYNRMDDLAAELYEKYVNELNEYAENVLVEMYQQGHEDIAKEVNTYIASRSEELRKRLKEDVDVVERKSNVLSQRYDDTNLNISQDKLKFSFKSIYDAAREKIKSFLK